jgi:hypothetical protein
MTRIARSWLPVLLLASVLAVPFELIAQNPPRTQTAPFQQSSAASLQQLLDRDDYIAYSEAMAHVDAASLTEPQRQYFLGMLAFHLGKLDDAAPLLIKGVNINDKSLTSRQVESALETLGQINLKLTYFGASAQMYDDIDKTWGSQMGDRAQAIREKRHLAALLQHVPKQTIQISGDFTLPRTGLEYPVGIPQQPNKQCFAQFDTGAEISVLSVTTAKAWGVTMLDGTATLHGYGGGGFAAQPGFIHVLTIGKAELRNVAVYVTSDENLYIAQIKRQTNALLGYSVLAALGRLTFAKDGSLNVSAQSPARDLDSSAALWLSGHSLLVELGTQPILSGGKLTASTGGRLFILDTPRAVPTSPTIMSRSMRMSSTDLPQRPLCLQALVVSAKSPRLELVMSRSSSAVQLCC